MIASVIPLIKLPKKLVFFDYEIPPEIKLNKFSVVIVPWRNIKIPALVINIKKSTKAEKKLVLKQIIKPINQGKPLATLNQFNLISELAENFLLSPSIWWKTILPKFPLTRAITFSIAKNIYKKVKKNNNLKVNINLQIKDTHRQMIDSIIDQINLDGQQLILCPEIIDINIIYNYLPENLKKQTVFYHKKLGNKLLLNNYFKIFNNQTKIIIGTKLAILLPFSNLKNIHVFKSDNYGFSIGDQNPRYNLDHLYNLINKIYKIPVNLYSLSPWVDMYAYLKKEKQEIKDNQKPINFQLIDMVAEKRAGNFSYISWPLEQAIKNTLSLDKKCLFFVNRKGLKQNIYCQDCGWQPTCAKCESYLKTQTSDILFCGVCQIKYPLPLTCPVCKSIKLKSFGLTNQSLVEILKKITNRNDVIYVDSENDNLPTNKKLIVATKYFIPRIDSSHGLIAFIDGDQELISHNYRSLEFAWQFFNNAFRTLPECQKIIQTKKIDHFFWEYLSQFTYNKFWQKEMHWRKKLNFPPYTKIIKLIIKEKNQIKLKTAKDIIIKQLDKDYINIIILNDFEIVFRFAYNYTDKIKEILSKLPESIMIEFNPYEI